MFRFGAHREFLAEKCKCGYKCVHVTDPLGRRWLSDDPSFVARLDELDRGLDGDETGLDDTPTPEEVPPSPDRPDTPPVSPRPARIPMRPIAARSAARAINPAAVFSTAAPAHSAPPETSDEPGDDAPAPPLAFAPPEARVRRPLLDLFPPSALEPDGPAPPALGTAVGPDLPPPRPRPVPKPVPSSELDALTYETFYGLREKPFSLSTDPRFLYQSASHERAGQQLLAAVRKRSGPAVLTGPLGVGKTTLCRSMVLEIDRRTVTSLVLDPLLSIDDLLKTMLVDFGVISLADLAGAPPISREVLTRTLTSFLHSLVPLQAAALVIIDEAHNLPVSLLRDLGALLGAVPAEAFQVVLVGQPALTKLLTNDDLRLLDASVARRMELGPLDADEIHGYVMHRLSVAGANTRIEFDDAAIARLYAWSGGVPRVVNLLCDRAMTRGQQSTAGVIDGALIEAAAADLDLDAPAGDQPGVLASVLLVVAFALLVLAGAAAALWVTHDAVARTMLQWQNIPVPPGGPIRRLPVPLAPIPPPSGLPDALRLHSSR